MRRIVIVLIASLLLAGCSGGQVDADAVATSVAATLQAQALLPTAETGGGLQALTGMVEGSICFPSEGIPPMNLYLQLAGSGEPLVFPIAQNQSTFSAEVPTGTYTAYAWLPDFLIGGSYSQAVACGLTVDCTDHSLVEFEVPGGGTTAGIQVCDWYGAPGDVPLPAGAEVQATPGSIAGTLSYPSEMIPPLQVIAFDTDNQNWTMILTVENQSTFQIDNLPPGEYTVVAYVAGDDFGGGYTAAVPCGLSVDCEDHSLIVVLVQSGQVTDGIQPHDWYAPPGAFPENPAN
ncbi:MAG: hypothetical protein WEC16_01875 [Anaerolineales bacterium]